MAIGAVNCDSATSCAHTAASCMLGHHRCEEDERMSRSTRSVAANPIFDWTGGGRSRGPQTIAERASLSLLKAAIQQGHDSEEAKERAWHRLDQRLFERQGAPFYYLHHDPDVVEAVLARAQIRQYSRGRVIQQHGHQAGALFIVLSGLWLVIHADADVLHAESSGDAVPKARSAPGRRPADRDRLAGASAYINLDGPCSVIADCETALSGVDLSRSVHGCDQNEARSHIICGEPGLLLEFGDPLFILTEPQMQPFHRALTVEVVLKLWARQTRAGNQASVWGGTKRTLDALTVVRGADLEIQPDLASSVAPWVRLGKGSARVGFESLSRMTGHDRRAIRAALDAATNRDMAPVRDARYNPSLPYAYIEDEGVLVHAEHRRALVERSLRGDLGYKPSGYADESD